MDPKDLRSAIEAILFAADEPVTLDELVETFSGESREAITAQLDELKKLVEETFGGFMLEQAAGGWRLATRADHHDTLKKFFARKGEGRLSIAALETLAIVAYRQPITAPEISDIRGVNSTGVLRTLLERKMVRVAGRKNVVGSPFLYRTTREFLLHFGLNDIQDLPRLEEFADLIGENIADDLAALPMQASMFNDSAASLSASASAGAAAAQVESTLPLPPVEVRRPIVEPTDDETIDRELREQGVVDIPEDDDDTENENAITAHRHPERSEGS
jgi:segregation and condensation protein B